MGRRAQSVLLSKPKFPLKPFLSIFSEIYSRRRLRPLLTPPRSAIKLPKKGPKLHNKTSQNGPKMKCFVRHNGRVADAKEWCPERYISLHLVNIGASGVLPLNPVSSCNYISILYATTKLNVAPTDLLFKAPSLCPGNKMIQPDASPLRFGETDVIQEMENRRRKRIPL